MILETKYNEGDAVWLVNPKTAKIVRREVSGIRTQSLNTVQRTIYCFVKDWCKDKENPTVEDCFWVAEENIFQNKNDLIKSL